MEALKFWEQVKKARSEKAMTQTEVARTIGVSLSGYRTWESGAGRPNPENLKKLEKTLSFTMVAT